jgi:hypothetical protein
MFLANPSLDSETIPAQLPALVAAGRLGLALGATKLSAATKGVLT